MIVSSITEPSLVYPTHLRAHSEAQRKPASAAYSLKPLDVVAVDSVRTSVGGSLCVVLSCFCLSPF